MKTWITLAAAAACCLATSCAAMTEEPGAGDEPAPTIDERVEGSVRAIGSLLRARHVADLPSCATLARQHDPALALRRIADDQGQPWVTRARALERLGCFPGSESEAVLITAATDPRGEPKLRAAAALGLAGLDLAGRDDLRALLVGLGRSPDPRLSLAAVKALVTAGADEELAAIADSPSSAAAAEAAAALQAE